MKPECQAKNLKGLDMVAVGVNKSAGQYMLLDEGTKADLARGKYHDQRRGTFGQPESAPGQPGAARPAAPAQADAAPADAAPATPPRPGPPGRGPSRPPSREPRLPGTASQRRLAVCTTSRACAPTRSPGSWG